MQHIYFCLTHIQHCRIWFDFCFTALQHILGHFGHRQNDHGIIMEKSWNFISYFLCEPCYSYLKWGKCCPEDSIFLFGWIFIKFTDNQERYKISNEFKFRLNQTTYSCIRHPTQYFVQSHYPDC